MNGRSQRQRLRNNDPRDYEIAFAHTRVSNVNSWVIATQ